jgi:hypothetical protein
MIKPGRPGNCLYAGQANFTFMGAQVELFIRSQTAIGSNQGQSFFSEASPRKLRCNDRARNSQIAHPDRTILIDEVDPRYGVACIKCLQVEGVNHLPHSILSWQEHLHLELPSAV